MKTCGECNHIGDYTTGPFSRNPHYCCELLWSLIHEEVYIDPNDRDIRCPLILEEYQNTIKKLNEIIK